MKYGQIVLKRQKNDSHLWWGRADAFCPFGITYVFGLIYLVVTHSEILIEAFDLPIKGCKQIEIIEFEPSPHFDTRAKWWSTRIKNSHKSWSHILITANLLGALGIEPQADTYFYVKATAR